MKIVAMRGRNLMLMAMIATASVCVTAQDRTAASTEGVVTGFVRYGGRAVADVRLALIDPRERSSMV
jgi:hypothetical protein